MDPAWIDGSPAKNEQVTVPVRVHDLRISQVYDMGLGQVRLVRHPQQCPICPTGRILMNVAGLVLYTMEIITYNKGVLYGLVHHPVL